MGIRRRHEAMQSSTFFLVALAAVLAAACASDSDLYAQESELFQNILKEQPEPPIPEKPMTKQVDPAKKHKLRGGKNPAKLVQAKVAAKVVTTSRRRYSGGSRRRAVVVSSRRRGGFSSGRRRRHYYSSSGGLCFPNKATVQTKTRGTVPISELSVGDEVMTGKGFAEVMFFAVHKPDADAEHLKITTSTRTLVVSASHGLFDADSHPILAGKVKVGDILHSAGVVDQIEKVKAKGLIAPITTTGTLVVDGVTTSDYGPFAQRVGHGVAHAAMAPIRFLRWAFPGWSVWHPTEAA